jgi:hypothetical protein
VAGARHPQGGTGYGHYHGGYYGHSHGYYGHSHGYYPYYPYYYPYAYYGYGYPSFGLSFSWGYPSYSYYPVPYAAPSYGVGYSTASGGSEDYSSAPPASDYGDDQAPPPQQDDPRYAPPPPQQENQRYAPSPRDHATGSLRIEVRPEDTSVYVDDQFRGTAREARGLSLPPGHHTIELVRPGFATEHREVQIVAGQRHDLLVEMQHR